MLVVCALLLVSVCHNGDSFTLQSGVIFALFTLYYLTRLFATSGHSVKQAYQHSAEFELVAALNLTASTSVFSQVE